MKLVEGDANIPSEVLATLTGSISVAEEALNSDSIDSINNAFAGLELSLHSVASTMYSNDANSEGSSDSDEPADSSSDVIDADFEEVAGA